MIYVKGWDEHWRNAPVRTGQIRRRSPFWNLRVSQRRRCRMDRIELPSSVVPHHYQVEITPRLDAMAFRGRAVITVEALVPTSVIVMNSADLVYFAIEIRGNVILSGTPAIDLSNKRVIILFDQILVKGKY